MLRRSELKMTILNVMSPSMLDPTQVDNCEEKDVIHI